MKRLVVFSMVAAMIWSLEVVWSSSLEPGTSSRLALQQFGNQVAADVSPRKLAGFARLRIPRFPLPPRLPSLVG